MSNNTFTLNPSIMLTDVEDFVTYDFMTIFSKIHSDVNRMLTQSYAQKRKKDR